MNWSTLAAASDSLEEEVGHKEKDITLKNCWLVKLSAVTLWPTGIYALVEHWKDCCFIVPLLSAMSLIKFSTVVVWRLFEDKCFSAYSGVLTRAKSEKSINVPDASSNLDFIFLYRCVFGRGEISVRTTAAGIFKHIAMSTKWHTIHKAVQRQRVCREQLPLSSGIQASHQAAECSQTRATGFELWTCTTPGSSNGGSRPDLLCVDTHTLVLYVHPQTQTLWACYLEYTQSMALNVKLNITVCIRMFPVNLYSPVSHTESQRAL